MLEQKLNTLRNLIFLMLVIVLVMGGIIWNQAQQINKNRDTLLEMRKQAENAMGQFTPTLDARLNKFETRVDAVQEQINGVQGKLQAAEDRFIQRIDRELPIMLDRYMDKKMKEINNNPELLNRR